MHSIDLLLVEWTMSVLGGGRSYGFILGCCLDKEFGDGIFSEELDF